MQFLQRKNSFYHYQGNVPVGATDPMIATKKGSLLLSRDSYNLEKVNLFKHYNGSYPFQVSR